MADNIRWGLDNPHPFSKMKTELIWEGKYDEYGNRRAVNVAGNAMPLHKIGIITISLVYWTMGILKLSGQLHF